MSDSNKTKVGIVREAVYGVLPATPAFKNQRITGCNLKFTPETVESKELRSDRRVQDLIRVGKNVGGTLPLEVSWLSMDDLLEYALQSSWVRQPVRDNNGVADSVITDVSATTGIYTVAAAGPGTDFNAGTFVVGQLVRATGFTNAANNGLYRASAAAGGTSVTLGNTSVAEAAPPAAARLKVVGFRGVAGDITATATGLAATTLALNTLGLVPGMWLKIGGSVAGEQFATAANNAWVRVSGTVTAGAIPLDNLPVGWSVDTGATKTITVYTGDYLRDGMTEQSMAIEKQYLDLAAVEYDYYLGMVPEITIDLKAKSVVNATATFKGADANNSTTRAVGATDIAAPSNDVMKTTSNLGMVAEGGTLLVGATAVTALTLALTNSLRDRPGLFSEGNVDIGSGTFRCKGKMSMYYASNAIRSKILSGLASSFVSRIVDTTAAVGSRAYTIDIPKIKFEGGDPSEPGIDTDRTIDPEFQALAHPTFGYAFQIQRTEEYSA